MAFSAIPGRAVPGGITPGLVLFPSSGPPFRAATRPARAAIPRAAPRGRVTATAPVHAATPPRPPLLVLGATGEPYLNWATGGLDLRWAAGEPYLRWEAGAIYTSG